ncbi:MAG: DeoR family transcriptional regulator [Chloroflexi bacterium]|nr:DeoR family transcriptional regulator [Chloroflexota bacterium]
MLLARREAEILTLVNQKGGRTVKDLAFHFGVTEVTIRRDLRKLEQLHLIKRTHGAAISLDNSTDWVARLPTLNDDPDTTDALILAPVPQRVAHTLRERALRQRIPFIAESCPQENGVYLGPNNFEAGHALGEWTGRHIQQHGSSAVSVLDISQYSLPNARERSLGFLQGLGSVLPAHFPIYSIDGNGLYHDAYRAAKDALQLHPDVSVLFGVNDDSILAGIQAYADLDRDPTRLIAVNVGGEGKTIFDVLAQGGPLQACAALFPEIVGRLAIDAAVRLWQGEAVPNAIITPYRILTPANLENFYIHRAREWELLPQRFDDLLDPFWLSPLPAANGRAVSFVILYRTHEWYQNVARAMQRRADECSVVFQVRDWKDDLSQEIRELQRLIGKLAASYVNSGDTIILDAGATTEYTAPFLADCGKITVITNAANVFQRLQTFPNVEVLLTGGKFDPGTRSFLGRGAHLLLRELRVDKAFIVARGVSTTFGLSAASELVADVQRSMIQAAREVIVLADHTLLDAEADFFVAGLSAVDTLITDAGITPAQRLNLTHLGIKVLIAGQVPDSR